MSTLELRVEFCGEEYAAEEGQQLSFGRAADIVIDDNRYLHRTLGEFRFTNGLWWVVNVGSSIGLSLHDDATPSMARIAPGSSMPIAFESSTLRFSAGGANYELVIDVVGELGPDDDPDVELDDSDAAHLAERTTLTTKLPLTDDQFALLVALAAPLLRNEEQLPTNRQLAHHLGWTVTKYNRKLDGLCAKFAKAGVAGLHGSSDQLAKDRRGRLAEHVVHSGIVRVEHLDE